MLEVCKCGGSLKAATTRGFTGVECKGCGRRELNPAESLDLRMDLKAELYMAEIDLMQGKNEPLPQK